MTHSGKCINIKYDVYYRQKAFNNHKNRYKNTNNYIIISQFAFLFLIIVNHLLICAYYCNIRIAYLATHDTYRGFVIRCISRGIIQPIAHVLCHEKNPPMIQQVPMEDSVTISGFSLLDSSGTQGGTVLTFASAIQTVGLC